MSYTSKFVAAVIGLFVTALFASRELFLFTVLRDAQGVLNTPGGRYHLGLAVSAGIAACIAGGLMFHFFVRLQKIAPSKVLSTPAETLVTSNGRQLSKSAIPTRSASIHWPRINLWLSEGQADDRMPMNGAVAESGGSAAEQRSFARQSHQAMFKKWSQARHD